MYKRNYLQATEMADRIAQGEVSAQKASERRQQQAGIMSRLKERKYEESDTESPFSLATDYISMLRERIQGEEPMVEEGIDTQALSEEIPSSGQQRPIARPGTPVAADTSAREILAKTIKAEAGGETFKGKLAVGSVIANRVSAGGTYGDSLVDVILKPGQFSAWNLATGYAKGEGGLNMDKMKPSEEDYKVADMILSGNYESPVGSATHYYNDKVATPRWGKEAGGEWTRIGNHIFGFAN